MCHACVIDSVKSRMLSRRALLGGVPAVAAAAALAPLAGPALAQAPTQALDLTHTLDADFPTFFGVPGIGFDQKFNWTEHKFNLFELTVNEHTGTHIDAPLHFSENGWSVDEIPVERLVAPLCVIDVREQAAADTDYRLTPDDIRAWTDAHGPIPEGACVAMLSGWDKFTADPKFRGADAEDRLHFPGFHVEAAQMLLETGAAGIGVDTLSLDHGPSPDFATHYAWLPENRFGLECMANLDALPAAGATLIVGAPKHRGGSGGPARLIALV